MRYSNIMSQITTDRAKFLADVREATHSATVSFFDSYGSLPSLTSLSTFAKTLIGGGKQLRASLVWAGALCGTDAVYHQSLVKLAAAVELYQISALVHDDLIDQADTRRGKPTTHVWGKSLHRENHGTLTDFHFGLTSAVLLGDIFLPIANSLATEASSSLPARSGWEVLEAFNRMTAQVAVGQYLDVYASAFPTTGAQETCERASEIIENKTISYSASFPLQLGAHASAAKPETIEILKKLGYSWGFAFQLRDDELGIFGSEETTGKPAGGDLIEGKRTMLIGYTLELADAEEVDFINRCLGSNETSAEDIAHCQEIMKRCGAYDKHEKLIEHHAQAAENIINELSVSESAKSALREIGGELINRKF